MRILPLALLLVAIFQVITPTRARAEYLRFPDRSAAYEWYQKNQEYFGQSIQILDLKSSRYESAEKILKEVYAVIDPKGDAPQFLIADEEISPYVMGRPGSQNRPFLVILSNNLVGSNALYFTLAHELAHLILQPPGDIRKISFGGGQNNSEAEKMWERWNNLFRIVGLSHAKDFNEVPLARLNRRDESLFRQLLKTLTDGCPLAKEKRQNALTILATAPISNLTDDYVSLPKELGPAILNFKKEAEACISNMKPSGAHVLRLITEKLLKMLWQRDEDIAFKDEADFLIAAEKNEEVAPMVEYFSKILGIDLKSSPQNFALDLWRVTGELAKERLRLESEMTRKNLRFYSAEDFADEEAVKIMKKLKKPVKSHFRTLGLTDDEDKQCRAMIKKSEPIPYGSFAYLHHSPCWRLKRNLDLEASL